MVKNHMKRIAAPKSWALQRKERVFITRPNPGRGFELAMSLNQVMKVLIQKGQTTKEVRDILFKRGVEINGTREYDHRRPVGFLDVVSFPDIKEHYVISLTKKGRLCAIPISDKEAQHRLIKVRGKTRTGGRVQLNGRDGTNVLVDKDSYATGDTIVVGKGKIAKHLPLKAGARIMLVGGSHLGTIGTVKEVEGRTIIFDAEDGTFSTAKRHAFVVGDKDLEVTLR